MATLAQPPPPATHPTYPPTTSDLPPLIPSSNQPLPPAMSQSEPATLAVTDHDHDLDRKMKESPRSSMDDMAGEKAEVVHTGVEPVMTGPKLNIRFLMMTGQSQVYSFHADDNIGKVKDLVWTYWPAEWQTTPGRPAASNYFRLLFMGKQLADNESLSTLNLRTAPAATIIHLAIRPFPPAPEETPKKSLLPFSLPTLPRPGGSRQNSANVPLVSPSLATTNANTGSVAPAGGGGTAAGVAGTGTGAAAGAGAASGARSGAGAAGGAAGTNAGQTRARGGEDSHGGGCKCVIM